MGRAEIVTDHTEAIFRDLKVDESVETPHLVLHVKLDKALLTNFSTTNGERHASANSYETANPLVKYIRITKQNII